MFLFDWTVGASGHWVCGAPACRPGGCVCSDTAVIGFGSDVKVIVCVPSVQPLDQGAPRMYSAWTLSMMHFYALWKFTYGVVSLLLASYFSATSGKYCRLGLRKDTR